MNGAFALGLDIFVSFLGQVKLGVGADHFRHIGVTQLGD